MIFILHYILATAGMPAILVLLAIYLQKYSAASLSGIGTLLMILPFLGSVVRPLVCAMADRHQAHQLYLILMLSGVMVGYGSLVIAPFFPEFVEEHGDIVWYLDIIGVCVGYTANAGAWQLGDAMAANAAQRRGKSWGSYRAWATAMWGISGMILGVPINGTSLNEVECLPKYTPGFIVLITALFTEIVLLAFWPKEAFKMSQEDDEAIEATSAAITKHSSFKYSPHSLTGSLRFASINQKPRGTSSGSIRGTTLNAFSVANVIIEDIGGTINQSLRRRQNKKVRPTIGQVYESKPAPTNADAAIQGADHIANIAANGDGTESNQSTLHKHTLMKNHLKDELPMTTNETKSVNVEEAEKSKPKDLQIELLRLIIKRNPLLVKFQILSVIYGILMHLHLDYFFLQIEEICREKGYQFSLVTGCLLAAQSASEVFGFLVLERYYIPYVGRFGSMLTVPVIFSLRYLFYATYFPYMSPYWAIPAEVSHGFAYSITYSLIIEISADIVDNVHTLMPDLLEAGIIDSSVKPSQLKAPLRATCTGICGGAFDGVGAGLGGLIGGIYLDHGSYRSLWALCSLLGASTAVVSIISECTNKYKTKRNSDKQVQAATS